MEDKPDLAESATVSNLFFECEENDRSNYIFIFGESLKKASHNEEFHLIHLFSQKFINYINNGNLEINFLQSLAEISDYEEFDLNSQNESEDLASGSNTIQENRSINNEVIPRSEMVTVIDLNIAKAETFNSYREAIQSYNNLFFLSSIRSQIDKNLIYKDTFIFKTGFFGGLTTNVNTPVSLSHDQIEMFKNSHHTPKGG